MDCGRARPHDVVGLAAGLVEDFEERGIGERHAREVQHDRLAWGEVRLDCALEVVEARHVNLAPHTNEREFACFSFQVAGHSTQNLALRCRDRTRDLSASHRGQRRTRQPIAILNHTYLPTSRIRATPHADDSAARM